MRFLLDLMVLMRSLDTPWQRSMRMVSSSNSLSSEDIDKLCLVVMVVCMGLEVLQTVLSA